MDKPIILICDDEEGIRESLKLILEGDYNLVFAKSGIEALDLVKKNKVDVVLLDIKMPKISGLETLQKIKEISADTAVIIITGYQSVDMAAQAIKAGAANYIVKPFDRKQVLDAVSGAGRV